jgi:Cyclin, N-terminal domain/Cyclin, C-terminal domain
MLKLRMCPRKRAKRYRAIPHRLRLPSGNNTNLMDVDEKDLEDGRDDAALLADNVHALIMQEQTGKYDCSDYLSVPVWQQNATCQVIRKPKFEMSPPRAISPVSATNTRIDEYCREQIVEWSFRVVDYFHIDREVVAVSLSFLDRFLERCRCDRTSFKLAATTTLHLAVKLLYPCKLGDLGILSDLSRGEFEMSDVNRMESNILHTLSWNLHPPTSCAFGSLFLDYFFASRVVTMSGADVDDIYDVSAFFSELAVCDYTFTSIRPSTIALAAILNALEGMFGPDNGIASDVLSSALALHNASFNSMQDLHAARNRLWELYERSEECALHNETSNNKCDLHSTTHNQHGNIFVKKVIKSQHFSPVSVSKPCHSATDFGISSHGRFLRNESW